MKKKLTVVYTGVGLICLLCLVLSIVLVRGSLDELGLSTMFPGATPSADPEKVILYKQPKNPTEIQEGFYDELIEVTQGYPEVDPYVASEKLAKCFISDFYTWTNKDGNFDVGGLDYLYGPHHLTFGLYARDTYYQNFNHFESEYGVENLMEVESVTLMNSAYGGQVNIDEEKMESYYLELEWTYKPGSSMDTSKLQHKAGITVIDNKISGRYEIIRIMNIE